MRFRSTIRAVNQFIKLTASLNLLGKIAWMRIDNDNLQLTVVPEHGSQVWAVLPIHSIFEDDFSILSAAPNNAINLEVPLAPLHRALKSAQAALSVSLRLTKKDNIPLLSLTIQVPTPGPTSQPLLTTTTTNKRTNDGRPLHGAPPVPVVADPYNFDEDDDLFVDLPEPGPQGYGAPSSAMARETTITQSVAVRVMPPASVEGIHEPRCPPAEVHIELPSLLQLKAVSERFTRLALSSSRRKGTTNTTSSALGRNAVGAGGRIGGIGRGEGAGVEGDDSLSQGQARFIGGLSTGPKLEVKANMHGELRVGMRTEALKIESRWQGLKIPEMDPGEMEGGEEEIANHPSTRMRGLRGEEGWAKVRVEGRDWGKVLGVGRLGGRVVACFCHDRALILYVFLANDQTGQDESCLTYYITSYAT